MRLTVKYEYPQEYNGDLHIKIMYRGNVLGEARITIAGRNKDEITNAKLRFITDFCREHSDISPKDILKAFSVLDEVLLHLYKTQYPQGGYRGGGRPKSTNRTETLNQRLTPAEKTYLLDQLERYRKRHVLIDAIQKDKNGNKA